MAVSKRSPLIFAVSSLFVIFAVGGGSAHAQGASGYQTGIPDPRTFAGAYQHPQEGYAANRYFRSGHWDAAANQRKSSPRTYDPSGGAMVHNSRNRVEAAAAAKERAEAQRRVEAQGAALRGVFSQPGMSHAVTTADLPTTTGSPVRVRFEVEASGRFTLTIPSGQWMDVADNRRGPNAQPVVVSGQINPQTGMFATRQKGTNVVGHIDTAGRVVLQQLDAILNNNQVRRLTKNKRVKNTIRGSSYRSETPYAEHVMGSLVAYTPAPALVATAAVMPNTRVARPKGASWTGALFSANVLGHSSAAGNGPDAELAFPGTRNTSGKQDVAIRVVLRRGKDGVQVRARMPKIGRARSLSYDRDLAVTLRGALSKGNRFTASSSDGAYAVMGKVGSGKNGPTLKIESVVMYGAAQTVGPRMRTSFGLRDGKAQRFLPRRVLRRAQSTR